MLRYEVDLATLSEHLLAVVEETMRPEHVSLWPRSPAHYGTQWFPRRAMPDQPRRVYEFLVGNQSGGAGSS